jgi:hypothetical protein
LLFEKVKTALKERHFESIDNIQRSVTQVLKDSAQNAFQERYNGSAAGKMCAGTRDIL